MAPETDCHLDQQNAGVLFLASAGLGVLCGGAVCSEHQQTRQRVACLLGSGQSLKAEVPHSPQG